MRANSLATFRRAPDCATVADSQPDSVPGLQGFHTADGRKLGASHDDEQATDA